jgi:hypothetical protein
VTQAVARLIGESSRRAPLEIKNQAKLDREISRASFSIAIAIARAERGSARGAIAIDVALPLFVQSSYPASGSGFV